MPGKSPLIFVACLVFLGCSQSAETQGTHAGSAGAGGSVDASAGASAAGTGAGSTGAGGDAAGGDGSGGSAAGNDAGGAEAAGGESGAGGSQEPDEDALIVPQGLSVVPLSADNGGLVVIALTLRQGPSSGEIYAAVRSDRDTPACSPSFSVNVYDKADQHVAAGLSGLLLRSFYRMAEDSSPVACMAPGEVSMVAISDLPSNLVLEDLGRIEYWSNFWALDVEPLGEINIEEVQTVTRSAGVAYTGALVNGLDIAVSDPSVAVFPLTRAGRPLGVTYGSGTVEVPPGGSWDFETDTSSEAGVDFAAYPASGP